MRRARYRGRSRALTRCATRPPLLPFAAANKLGVMLNEDFNQSYADDDLAYMLQVRRRMQAERARAWRHAAAHCLPHFLARRALFAHPLPPQQFSGGDAGAVDFFAFATTLHSRMADPRYNESFGDAFDLFTNASGAGELTVRRALESVVVPGFVSARSAILPAERARHARATRAPRAPYPLPPVFPCHPPAPPLPLLLSLPRPDSATSCRRACSSWARS